MVLIDRQPCKGIMFNSKKPLFKIILTVKPKAGMKNTVHEHWSSKISLYEYAVLWSLYPLQYYSSSIILLNALFTAVPHSTTCELWITANSVLCNRQRTTSGVSYQRATWMISWIMYYTAGKFFNCDWKAVSPALYYKINKAFPL